MAVIEIRFLNIGLTVDTFSSLSQTGLSCVSSDVECNGIVDGFNQQGFSKMSVHEASNREKEGNKSSLRPRNKMLQVTQNISG